MNTPLLAASGPSARIDRLARRSVLAFATYVAGVALTSLSQLLVARLIGSTAYGYYAYALAWMTILTYVAALGFDVSLLRWISAYCAQQQWGLARGVLRYAQGRTLAASGVIVLAAGLALGLGAPAMPEEQVRTFVMGLALIPILSALWIASAAARAFGAVVAALTPDRVVRDGGLVIVVLVLLLWRGATVDASTVMMISVGCTLCGLIVVHALLRRHRPQSVAVAVAEYAPAAWRATALPLVVIAASETVLNRTGVLLFGWIGAGIAAGVYALSFNIAMMVTLPRTAVNAGFAPMVAELYVRGDLAELQSVVTRAAMWTLLSGLCIAVPLGILAHPLLRWFGPDFTHGVTALRVLLSGQLVACAFGPQMYLMTMTGNERSVALLLCVSTILGAAVGAVLIRSMGLTGAAIAASAALILWNASMAVIVWRKLGLVPGLVARLGVKRATGRPRG